MAKNKSLEAFWKQNDGRLIKSYGSWLIAYGILLGIIAAFFLFVFLANSSDFTGYMMPVVILYYAIVIAAAIYYVNRGNAIRKALLTPAQMSLATTLVLVLMFGTLIFNAILSGSSAVILGLLDIITLAETIKYKCKWHKSYVSAYNGDEKIITKKVNDEPMSTKEEQESETNSDGDEYYDDML